MGAGELIELDVLPSEAQSVYDPVVQVDPWAIEGLQTTIRCVNTFRIRFHLCTVCRGLIMNVETEALPDKLLSVDSYHLRD